MIYNNNLDFSLVDFNFVDYLYKFLKAQHKTNSPLTVQGQLLTIGAKYQKAGQMQQAKKIYNKILQFDPTCAPARHRLGIILFLTGDPIGAIKLIDSAVVLQPDNAIFYMSLVKVLQLQSRWEEANAALPMGIMSLLNITADHGESNSCAHSFPHFCNTIT